MAVIAINILNPVIIMKTKFSLLATVCAVAVLSWSGLALSDELSIAPATSAAGIEYVSGGVGADQREDMAAVRQLYNLHLTFARPKSGAYLAGVNVVIRNSKKETLLEEVADGPMLFARLPAGTYQVMAAFEGKQQTKAVSVGARGARGLVYYFAQD